MKRVRFFGFPAVLCAIVALATAPVLLVARDACAESVDARLVLRIEGPLPAGVSAESLRVAIATELGVEIALDGPGVQGRGTVVVVFEAHAAVVIFALPDGRQVRRDVALPSDTIIEVIALIVGNLARDEAADILAEIHVEIAAPTAPTPAPVPAPAPALAPAPAPAPGGCGSPRTLFGGDFVPGLGSSITAEGRKSVRILSLNLVGGMTHGLAGLEVSGGFNVETGFMCGVQIAGGANVVHGPMHGVQLTGGANVASDLHGAQIAGGASLARDGKGAQISGGFNLARDLEGAQIAPFNVVRSIHGAQLGVVNVAGRVLGAQVGVVNVADESDVSIGVINVVKHGRTHVSLFGTESGYFSLELLHGGRYVHNLFGLGVQPGYGDTRAMPALAYGIGVHAYDSSAFSLDVDALFTSLWRPRGNAEKTFEFVNLQPELRTAFSIPIAGQTALMFGPSVRLLLTTDPETKPRGPWGGIEAHDERGTSTSVSAGIATYVIPGLMFGLRL